MAGDGKIMSRLASEFVFFHLQPLLEAEAMLIRQTEHHFFIYKSDLACRTPSTSMRWTMSTALFDRSTADKQSMGMLKRPRLGQQHHWSASSLLV